MDNNEAPDLRETVSGIAIRAGLLAAGGLFIGGWMTALALKVASRAIHLLVILGLGLIVAGLSAYEAKNVQRRWNRDDVTTFV